MKALTACLLLLVAGAVHADGSLHEATNLGDFDVPDVLAMDVDPYDARLFESYQRVDDDPCCQRDMYRVDGTKLVLLSHDSRYFLAIMIRDDNTRMFFAPDAEGEFVEQNYERGKTWRIPEWLGQVTRSR